MPPAQHAANAHKMSAPGRCIDSHPHRASQVANECHTQNRRDPFAKKRASKRWKPSRAQLQGGSALSISSNLFSQPRSRNRLSLIREESNPQVRAQEGDWTPLQYSVMKTKAAFSDIVLYQQWQASQYLLLQDEDPTVAGCTR